jgi:hypothetical protein
MDLTDDSLLSPTVFTATPLKEKKLKKDKKEKKDKKDKKKKKNK